MECASGGTCVHKRLMGVAAGIDDKPRKIPQRIQCREAHQKQEAFVAASAPKIVRQVRHRQHEHQKTELERLVDI